MQEKSSHLNREYRQALDFYLQILKSQNKSGHTITGYRQDLQRFLSWYQMRYGLSLKSLDAQMISEYQHFMADGRPIRRVATWRTQWMALWRKFARKNGPLEAQKRAFQLKNGPLGANSRRRNMSSLHNFFTILLESSYFQRQFRQNPIRPNLHRIKVKEVDVEPTLVLSPQDWEILDEKTWRAKDRLLIYLLYYGGLRLSEVANLKRGDFDMAKGILELERKGGKRHRLKLWNGKQITLLWRAVAKKAAQQGPVAPLFYGHAGRAISPRGLSKRIKALLQKVGLDSKLGPHSFRKGCATALYQKTKDLLFVRDYLNHTDAKVTQTYIDEIGITQNFTTSKR